MFTKLKFRLQYVFIVLRSIDQFAFLFDESVNFTTHRLIDPVSLITRDNKFT